MATERRTKVMKTEKRVAKVGEKIIIIDGTHDEMCWHKTLYRIETIWKVNKVMFDKWNTNGIVYCENNNLSCPNNIYEVIVD
jgi:hypothetical protein